MRYATAFLCLLSFILVQCSINKKVISNKKSDSISSLVIFPVYSSIDVIERGDKTIRNDSLSYHSEKRIGSHLTKYLPGKIHPIYSAFDDSLTEKIAKETIGLIKDIRFPIGKVKMPGLLIHILDSLHEDYGLFIYHAGFSRTYNNQSFQYLRRKTIGFASLGFYNTEPNHSYSVMIGLIINRQERKVSMYKELFWRNKNPEDKFIVQSQVRDILLGYFNEPK